MTETTTTGIKAFPKLDILLPFPFTGSNFDEHQAELVGFCWRFNRLETQHSLWLVPRNFIHLGGYVNFSTAASSCGRAGLKPTTRI
jgi:hypothetical protein